MAIYVSGSHLNETNRLGVAIRYQQNASCCIPMSLDAPFGVCSDLEKWQFDCDKAPKTVDKQPTPGPPDVLELVPVLFVLLNTEPHVSCNLQKRTVLRFSHGTSL